MFLNFEWTLYHHGLEYLAITSTTISRLEIDRIRCDPPINGNQKQ